MDTDLVVRAQDGDKGAFATLAAARADRYLAASHRILRDIAPVSYKHLTLPTKLEV
jgi:hypothetical protein